MSNLITRVSRAGLMGLAWAAVWIPIGAIGAQMFVGELDPEHIGGPLYAGFFCGTVCSALLGIASERRRLVELSVSEAAVWGAASGALIGVLVFVVGEGKGTDADNARASAIVGACSIAAALAAGRGLLGRLTPARAATIAAILSALPTGALPWMLGPYNGIERFAPLVLMGALGLLSAVSAVVSLAVARRAANPTGVVGGL